MVLLFYSRCFPVSSSRMEEEEKDIASAGSESCSVVFCEACKQNGRKNVPTNYCRECKEYLCDKCTKQHKKMKRTETHIPVAADDKLKIDNNQCDRSTNNNARPNVTDTKK